MNAAFRSAALIALGFGLLVVQSAVTSVVPLHPFTPSVTLPIVIFLGVSPDVHITRGAAIAFALGYLHDLFCGNLLSLQTFVSVATFMLARGAGLRIVLRGPSFQAVATLLVALFAGGSTLALRAMFEARPPIPSGGVLRSTLALVPPALATALIAPVVFAAAVRIEGAKKRQEATA